MIKNVKIHIQVLILGLMFCFVNKAIAFVDNKNYVGAAIFFENNFGKLTEKSDSSKSTLGTTTIPFFYKHDWKIYSDFYISPLFSYTLFNRQDPDNSAKVTIWHLLIPIGKNIGSTGWDWNTGLGILNRTISGSGGQVQLANGNSVATFSLPGRTVSSKNFTFTGGGSFTYLFSRYGFDLITEGIFSSKLNINLMFSYSYLF